MKTRICIAAVLLSLSFAAAAADRPVIHVAFDIQSDHPYRDRYTPAELTAIQQSVVTCFTASLQDRFPLFRFVSTAPPADAHELSIILGDDPGSPASGLVRPVGFRVALDEDQEPDADYAWVQYRRGEEFVSPLPDAPVFVHELSKTLGTYVRSSGPDIVSKLLHRVPIAHGFGPANARFFYLEWKNDELGLANDSRLVVSATDAQDASCDFDATPDGTAPADGIPAAFRGGVRVKATGPTDQLPRLSTEPIKPRFIYVTRYSRLKAIDPAAPNPSGGCQ